MWINDPDMITRIIDILELTIAQVQDIATPAIRDELGNPIHDEQNMEILAR